MSLSISRRLFAAGVAAACLVAAPLAQTRQPFSRVAVTVTPDHPGWVYQPGEPVTFRIDVVRDGHPVTGTKVSYGVGPEMLPPVTEATAVVGSFPLTSAISVRLSSNVTSTRVAPSIT